MFNNMNRYYDNTAFECETIGLPKQGALKKYNHVLEFFRLVNFLNYMKQKY